MEENSKYSDIFSFSRVPKYIWDLIFVCLFIIVSIGFNYHEIMFKRPQGVHVWRQTDCASMALNYHQKNLPLFHPQMHYRLNSTSEAIGEFPIMYYVVGKMYSFFGYHEFIYRFLWYLIAFAGSFCLFRLAFSILKLPLESLFIGLMLFVSPVISFYAIGFISDPIALFLVPISLYILYSAFTSNNPLKFLLATIIISLAGTLKLSALLVPLAIFGVFFLYTLFNKNWKDSLLVFLGIVFVILVNYSWYDFAIQFNRSNNTSYFLMRIVPFWEIGVEEKNNLFRILKEDRLPQFYNSIMLSFMVILTFWAFLKKKLNIWIFTFVLVVLIGLVMYSLLFFQQFRYHDYYMINAVVVVPVFYIIAFIGIKEMMINRKLILTIKIALIFIMIRSSVMAANFVKRRYMHPENEFYLSKGYDTLEPYLEEKGIGKNDLVISIPDVSPNTTLYLMNRPGWSNLYHDPMKAGNIEIFKKMGAQYLIVGDDDILKDSLFFRYFENPIGKYKGISIFKL